MAYRLVRLTAVLAVIAGVLWGVVLQLVSSLSGTPVEGLLHTAQALSLLAFAGGLAVSLWNLVLVARTPGAWGAKPFAVLVTVAFAFVLYIALTYHLIGFSGEY